jgi:c-di-GMP-binding flagellar brake protein YcgR
MERRKKPRINVEIDVECNMSRDQNWFDAGTRDISCSGICMITRTTLTPGSTLNIKFRMPDTSRTVEVTGKIVWLEYLIEKKYYCTGVKFTSIKPGDSELINKYIDSATFEV